MKTNVLDAKDGFYFTDDQKVTIKVTVKKVETIKKMLVFNIFYVLGMLLVYFGLHKVLEFNIFGFILFHDDGTYTTEYFLVYYCVWFILFSTVDYFKDIRNKKPHEQTIDEFILEFGKLSVTLTERIDLYSKVILIFDATDYKDCEEEE